MRNVRRTLEKFVRWELEASDLENFLVFSQNHAGKQTESAVCCLNRQSKFVATGKVDQNKIRPIKKITSVCLEK